MAREFHHIVAEHALPDILIAVAVGLALMAGIVLLIQVSRRVLRFLPAPRLELPTEPVPSGWPGIIDRRVPLAARLTDAEHERLLRLTQMFLRDVPMEGVGLELNDEIRVTIAATACLLLVGLPYPRFSALRRVLVYPDTFVPVRLPSRHSHGIQEDPEPTLGEAWRDGMVVLSWTSVRDGGADGGDAHNVVLHEFAHILDGEDGTFDGTPILDSPDQARIWGQVFATEFAKQQHGVSHAHNVALDPYAATNRAEFFAVATETFFETGPLLKTLLPDLYAQLRQFYRQDPAARR